MESKGERPWHIREEKGHGGAKNLNWREEIKFVVNRVAIPRRGEGGGTSINPPAKNVRAMKLCQARIGLGH